MEITTIQLTEDTKEKISSFGVKGESYNDILKKVLEVLNLCRLSPEKARILHILKTKQPNSIYELTKLLGRNFKAVRQDLMVLEQFGVIKLIPGSSKIKKGQSKRKILKPIIAIDKLVINLEI